MIDHRVSTFFRFWIRLQGCPMRLGELRVHWQEMRRFLRCHPAR
jgi:hypothetical protein